MSKTLGEKRVRVDFNPSANGVVDQIKQKTAELINLVTGLDVKSGEKGRLVALAATGFEEAGMWAVKAATTTEGEDDGEDSGENPKPPLPPSPPKG